jgi:hypothetical protein
VTKLVFVKRYMHKARREQPLKMRFGLQNQRRDRFLIKYVDFKAQIHWKLLHLTSKEKGR